MLSKYLLCEPLRIELKLHNDEKGVLSGSSEVEDFAWKLKRDRNKNKKESKNKEIYLGIVSSYEEKRVKFEWILRGDMKVDFEIEGVMRKTT